MEGDPLLLPRAPRGIISTHALTWRATCHCRRPSAGLKFLPTPSHGGRPFGDCRINIAIRNFYPRPHMEGDPGRVGRAAADRHFYPRPHMEGDYKLYGQRGISVCISTHALTWRATPIYCKRTGIFPISTHALTWRATRGRLFGRANSFDFYPRPHMEGDGIPSEGDLLGRISTHALTWRATRRVRVETFI